MQYFDIRMKYRLFLIIATSVILGGMTSCSRDDESTVHPDGGQRIPISFNACIGEEAAEVSTRGYTPNINGTGYIFSGQEKLSIGITGVTGTGSTGRSTTEEVKVYNIAAGDASNTTGSPRALSFEGNAIDAFVWMGKNETLSLRAWTYGDDSTPTTDPLGNTFTIETNQNTGATADIKELLYSPPTNYNYATNNGSITIPLYHQLTRVIINIKSEQTLSSVIIGDSNLPTSATFGYTSGNYGTWSDHSGEGTIIPKDEVTTDGYDKTYSAVLIPGTGADYNDGSFVLKITTTDGVNTGNYLYAMPLLDNSFDPGMQYTFNISITRHLLSVTSITITPWTEDVWNIVAQ